MSSSSRLSMSEDRAEAYRYLVNGLFATAVHYTVLTININIFAFDSVGVANFVAAIFGISTSFIGSRYFVYRNHKGTISSHMVKFVLLYGFVALLHGGTLHIWTDIYHHSYQVGFILATLLQVLITHTGNKILVFK